MKYSKHSCSYVSVTAVVFIISSLLFLSSCSMRTRVVSAQKEKSSQPVVEPQKSQLQPYSFDDLSIDDIRNKKDIVAQSRSAAPGPVVDSSLFPMTSELVADWQARLDDVPACFELVPVPEHCAHSANRVMMVYQAALERTALVQFYSVEMERSGWGNRVIFDGINESILLFCKPHKTACICVRSIDKRVWFRVQKHALVTVCVQK